MKTLLITRPHDHAGPLAESAEQAGWRAICLPLFAITDIGSDAERRLRLDAVADADWWIFTSANAVAAARRAGPDRWARTAAIGAATATALESAGFPPEAVPEQSYSTEALLALPQFRTVEGQRIVIVGNEAARPTLAQRLAEGGAQVDSLPVYRLDPIEHDAGGVAAAVRDAGVTVLTSASAADRLWQLGDAATRRRLADMPLVVPSRRVADHCTRRGLHGPHAVAQPMSNAALLAAADTLPVMHKPENENEAPAAASAAPPESAPEPEGGATSLAAAPDAPAPEPAPPEAGAPAPDNAAETVDGGSGAPPAAPPAPPAPPAGRRRDGGVAIAILVLLWLLLAAAFAGASWWGWQRLQALEAGQEDRLASLADRVEGQQSRVDGARSDARAAASAAASADRAVKDLVGRVDTQGERLAEIARTVDAGRARAHIVAAEQLMLTANEHLQLGLDVDAALEGLALADERLAALDDPRFFAVREQLAEEMAALRSIERPDRTAMALKLSSLIARADKLRLRGGVPDASAPELPEHSQDADRLPAWQRAVASVREALSSVFVVRRTDVPVKPLMAPEQDGLVRSVLLLRLESARGALLAGEQATFDAALDGAVQWLQAQYADGDPGVDAAIATLRELRGTTLSPTLPDVGGSLSRLRRVADTLGGEAG